MKTLSAITLLAILLATSCNFPKPKSKSADGSFHQSWKVTRIEEDEDETFGVSITPLLQIAMKDGYLHLYKNGDYTLLGKNTSALGKWQHSEGDSTLTLTNFMDSMSAVFKVEKRDKEWINLRCMKLGNQEGKTTVLLKYDPHFEFGEVDLMEYDLNSWRIPPTHAESKAELKKRVLAHIDYMIVYFQKTIDSKQGYYETWQLQTPMRFYSNGISVDRERLEIWAPCFYSESDASEAMEILIDAMESINEYPSNTFYGRICYSLKGDA